MRFGVAQIKSKAGDIEGNIRRHKAMISVAAEIKSDALIFPELSITNYEPSLAKGLATDPTDARFDDFQKLSDINDLMIGVGMPIKASTGILIGMLIFRPNLPRSLYSKRYLHADEIPFFASGQSEIILDVKGERIAPSICYESLLPEHSNTASKNKITIYAASVAKPSEGIEKAMKHYPEIAKNHSMNVLMSNAVGHCDNFQSVGKSAVWNSDGSLLAQLNATDEGVLVLDTKTGNVITRI